MDKPTQGLTDEQYIEELLKLVKIKDITNHQQELIIRDQTDTINQQHNRIAELQYHIHQHDLLYEHPWQYFFWRIFVWPWHPDNKRGER